MAKKKKDDELQQKIDYFIAFMRDIDNLAENTYKNYPTHIKNASDWLKSNRQFSYDSIFDITDLDTFEPWYKIATGDSEFAKENKNKQYNWSSSIGEYRYYLQYKNDKDAYLSSEDYKNRMAKNKKTRETKENNKKKKNDKNENVDELITDAHEGGKNTNSEVIIENYEYGMKGG